MTTLAARQLGFGYPRQPVGRDVDLEVAPGEVLCLLGPNGSGKTTLFKTLLGLLVRQGGNIVLDGKDIGTLSRTQIARRVAYVPQAHESVFPYTVHDMVLMGRTVHRGLFSSPREHDAERAQQALDQLGIGDLASREFTRISGGQRQLALIARALAQDTPIVVMDEPTASLDFGNQVRVLQQVRKLSEAGLGIVLSTHNPDHALACASRVLVLADGTLQASGSPDTVLTGELLSSVYQVEVRLERLSHGQHVCVPHLDGNTGKRFRHGD